MTFATAAYGTSLKYKSPETLVAKISQITPPELSRDTIDVTDHESTNAIREFLMGLGDSGEVAIEGFYVADDAGQEMIAAHYADRSIRTLIITFPDGSTCEFDAGVTKLKPIGEANVDGAMTFSASFKVSGSPTFTPPGS